MKIETSRLRFRYFHDNDGVNLSLLDRDEEVMRYLTAGITFSLDESEERLQAIMRDNEKDKPYGVWAVEDKRTGEFIGRFMLKKISNFEAPAIGYRLAKKYWGQGLATEGVQALVEYGLETLGLEKIMAITSPENTSSTRVLDKSGFQYIKTIEFFNPVPQKLVETKLFEVSKESFRPIE